MKLELKHLAGYLPYKLDIFRLAESNNSQTVKLTTGVLTLWEDNYYDEFKPILRPLSDLAKEIEVNRKKFVPKEKLWDEIVYDTDEEYYRILKREWDEIDLIKSAPYRFVQRLQEWHFDIYGLIENGLAIDINTIK